MTKDILAVKIWAQRSLPPSGVVACLQRQRNWGDKRVNLQIWGEDKAEWISPGRNQHSSPQLVTVSHWVYNNVQCVDDKAVKCRHWTIVKRGKYIGRKGSAGWSMSKSIEWVMAPVTASLLLCCALLSASLLALPLCLLSLTHLQWWPLQSNRTALNTSDYCLLYLAEGELNIRHPSELNGAFGGGANLLLLLASSQLGACSQLLLACAHCAQLDGDCALCIVHNWMGIGWHAGVHIFRLSNRFSGSCWC